MSRRDFKSPFWSYPFVLMADFQQYKDIPPLHGQKKVEVCNSFDAGESNADVGVLLPVAPISGRNRIGRREMRIVIAMLFSLGLLALASAQENQATSERVTPSIGLEIGQRAPAFALSDQFGHEQSNETLKGSKGTVLLFFRSADW
jgi:hypothetical protein